MLVLAERWLTAETLQLPLLQSVPFVALKDIKDTILQSEPARSRAKWMSEGDLVWEVTRLPILSVALGTHQRLGAESLLYQLDPEVVRIISRFVSLYTDRNIDLTALDEPIDLTVDCVQRHPLVIDLT